MITYGKPVGAIYDRRVLITPVYLNNRRAGHIKQHVGGFIYAAKDARFGKEIFASMAQCKASIERVLG